MPTGPAITLIGFGAVLTTVSNAAGVLVAGVGFLFEAYVFYEQGKK